MKIKKKRMRNLIADIRAVLITRSHNPTSRRIWEELAALESEMGDPEYAPKLAGKTIRERPVYLEDEEGGGT
jgi:hypothetical protein